MIFVDTWAWMALADRNDQHHTTATVAYLDFRRSATRFVTSDYVLAESLTLVYRRISSDAAERFFDSLLRSFQQGRHRLETVTRERFDAAWELRRRYHGRPDISYVDLTSMVVMRELGINQVFTGDRHFEQVNLGFQCLPVGK